MCHSGHVLMENRHGLAMAVDAADGEAERRCAKAMLTHAQRRHGVKPATLGADTGYNDGAFPADVEQDGTVPHVPIREGPIRATDEAGEARRRARRRETTKGYRLSQWIRNRMEEIFGWMKTVGELARTRFAGRCKTLQDMLLTRAAYNLLRLVRLKPPDGARAAG